MNHKIRNILLGALLSIGLGVPYLQAADVAISALPAGSALGGTEPIPMVQGAATKKTTPADIDTYISGTTKTLTNKTLTSPILTSPQLGTPASGVMTNVTGLPLSTGVTGQLPLANGGTGANLTDPNADRIMFWDDSAGAVTWLTAGTGLTITGTTIDASGGGSGDVVGPASATDNAIARFDATTGKLMQDSGVTVSDVSGSSVTLASSAGNALAIAATAPAATTGASVAGKAASLTAGPAVASTDTAGAAAGGDVTITAGAAARLTSGNAAGGNIYLVPGAGIGTGAVGQVLLLDGAVSTPIMSFAADTNTGFYRSANDTMTFVANGNARFHMSNVGLDVTPAGAIRGSGASPIYGMTLNVFNRTSDASESSGFGMSIVTNAGATSLVTRTLPSAGVGATFTFVVMDADGLKIGAAAGDDIRVIDKITNTAGYIQSTTIGSVVTLVAVDATTWVATSIHGAWSDGTFTFDDTSLTTP